MTSSEELIRKDRYQIFLMASPASIPLNFAQHHWFVVNRKGVISRWDVVWGGERYDGRGRWGHLLRDMLAPFVGLRIIYFLRGYHWRGELLGMIEGGEGSLAARMVAAIEALPQTYPCMNMYSFFGPNSNTYVQWVLDRFPEANMHLPWNAFGKALTIRTHTP